jgi:hypothetical protein
MNLESALLLVVGATFGGMNAESGAQTFQSYTQAWHAAADEHRPMLVVLNPPEGEVSAGSAIDVAALRQDVEIAKVLGNYVVAAIDTGTEHGKKVHELFGSKALPRVVVIDANQKWQVYRTSERLEKGALKDVLETYRATGPSPAQWAAQQSLVPGYCPNCQRY